MGADGRKSGLQFPVQLRSGADRFQNKFFINKNIFVPLVTPVPGWTGLNSPTAESPTVMLHFKTEKKE